MSLATFRGVTEKNRPGPVHPKARAEADLVVMGAHKPDLIDRVQWPNSARVARYAEVSVLIVQV